MALVHKACHPSYNQPVWTEVQHDPLSGGAQRMPPLVRHREATSVGLTQGASATFHGAYALNHPCGLGTDSGLGTDCGLGTDSD